MQKCRNKLIGVSAAVFVAVIAFIVWFSCVGMTAYAAGEPKRIRLFTNNTTVIGSQPVKEVPKGATGETSVHCSRVSWTKIGTAVDCSSIDKSKLTLELWIYISDLAACSGGLMFPDNLGFNLEDSTGGGFSYWLTSGDINNWANGWTKISIRFYNDRNRYPICLTPYEGIDLSSMIFSMYAPMFDDLYLHDVYVTESEQAELCKIVTTDPRAFPARGISLDRYDMKMQTGSQTSLQCTVKPRSAQCEVSWSVSDPEVISVDSNGLITAKKEGTAYVTALATDLVFGESKLPVKTRCRVTVADIIEPDRNRSIRISLTNMAAGAFKSTTTFSPDNDGSKTAFANFRGDTAGGLDLFNLTQFNREYTVLAFDLFLPDKESLFGEGNPNGYVNGRFGFSTTIFGTDWSNNNITYKINSAMYDALNVGWQRVAIRLADMTQSGELTWDALSFFVQQVHTVDADVNEIGFHDIQVYESEQQEPFVITPLSDYVEAEKVEISFADKLVAGQSDTIALNFQPANATAASAPVRYSSSDKSIATVTSSGRVTAVAPGLCILNVHVFGADNAVTKVIRVVANDKPLTSLSLKETSVVKKKGDVFKIEPVTNETTESECYYTSSDTSVVAVDRSGNVTVVGEGRATVRVTSAAHPELYAEMEISTQRYNSLVHKQNVRIILLAVILPLAVCVCAGVVITVLILKKKRKDKSLKSEGGENNE